MHHLHQDTIKPKPISPVTKLLCSGLASLTCCSVSRFLRACCLKSRAFLQSLLKEVKRECQLKAGCGDE